MCLRSNGTYVHSVNDFLRDLQGETSVEKTHECQSRLLKFVSVGFMILVGCVLYLLKN